MATEPIIVTDTDDLRRMFAANIAGFTGFQMLPDVADRLAGSLIEILGPNCAMELSPLAWALENAFPDVEERRSLRWVVGYVSGAGTAMAKLGAALDETLREDDQQ